MAGYTQYPQAYYYYVFIYTLHPMIFACTQENLLQGISLVSHVTGKNANLPVLENVLLKTEEGHLKLSATNLEISISAIVRGRVEAPGEYTVPAKLFQEYISLLGSGKVELSLKDEGLEVKSDDKTTIIKGVAAGEFPLIPKPSKGSGYRFAAEGLRQAISQVVFAVSSSSSRPELAGVSCAFHPEDHADQLVMAATDSYRLSERVVPLLSGGSVQASKCIVPARALQEMMRVLGGYKDDVGMPEAVDLSIAENQLLFAYGNVELVSRLIDGSFPDYRPLIPQQFRTKAIVTRTDLQKAIRAASLFARHGIQDVTVAFTSNGSVTVSASDSGTGAHNATLKAVVEGEDNRVVLNFKYVSDGLNAFSGDNVTLQMIDAYSPIVLSSGGSEKVEGGGDGGSQFKYIVMPIRQ